MAKQTTVNKNRQIEPGELANEFSAEADEIQTGEPTAATEQATLESAPAEEVPIPGNEQLAPVDCEAGAEIVITPVDDAAATDGGRSPDDLLPGCNPPSERAQYITIRIPLSTPPGFPAGGAQAEARTHVDTKLGLNQASALRHLLFGLRNSNAKLANGDHIRFQSETIRWLFDRIVEQVPACQTFPQSGD